MPRVGEALLVGRRLHKADQKFSQWCLTNGFDMSRKAKADAMWWAEVCSGYTPPDGITHPSNIRQWFNDIQASTPPIPEVGITEEDMPRLRITRETAKKVNKLAAMAEGGLTTLKC